MLDDGLEPLYDPDVGVLDVGTLPALLDVIRGLGELLGARPEVGEDRPDVVGPRVQRPLLVRLDVPPVLQVAQDVVDARIRDAAGADDLRRGRSTQFQHRHVGVGLVRRQPRVLEDRNEFVSLHGRYRLAARFPR